MKHSLILFLLAGIGLQLGACSKNPTSESVPQGRADVRVIAQTLGFQRQRTRVEAVGTSRARLSAELYAPTSGEVTAVNFVPGEAVKSGDVLVELDSREEILALQLAELELQDAERLYSRYLRSGESGAVLPTALDAARTAAEAARVEVERARVALDDRTIEAVFDGFVGSTDVDPGDRVTPDTLITTLDDRSTLFVSFSMPEAFLGEISVGDTVQLATWNGKVPVVAGEIVDIGSRVDPISRSFTARIGVRNNEDALRPGMSFRVAMDLEGERYGAIAETGLQWGADGAYVWVLDNGAALRVPVQIVQRRDGLVLVKGDINDGDVIVVEGTQRMRDGIAVDFQLQRLAGQPPIEPSGDSGLSGSGGAPAVLD